MSRTLLAAFGAALVAVTCTAPAPVPPPTEPQVASSRGGALFERHCAVCHGRNGDADTAVAALLLPRPAAFRDGLFKLVSTDNGVPSEDDLVRTLQRGMPGSTMFAWNWLPETDLRALAQHVMHLAIEGRAASIGRTAEAAGRPLAPADAIALAEKQLRPGASVDVGQPLARDAADLDAGHRLYERHCASCHGPDGRGLPGAANWPTDGTWLWPRDLTAGYLRGGAAHRDLACRIRAGMPGARMPPVTLSTAETETLVAYVRSLIPDGAAEHHVQWRRTIRAPKLAQLPAADDDAGFAAIEGVRLPITPIWWRKDAVHDVVLRAAHDGQDVVLRIEWGDGTRDAGPQHGQTMGDGVAVQFARTMDPPLFAMGSAAEPVNVWRWHAFDPRATAGMVDLLAGQRHAGLDATVGGGVAPAAAAESIQVGGPASARSATGSGAPIAATPQWRDGRWTLTFRRTLAARSADEVALAAGAPTLFALAVWDGAVDRGPASKSITTWHELELQR
jgi:DMSO reductase family type II enzyme heme b subunit